MNLGCFSSKCIWHWDAERAAAATGAPATTSPRPCVLGSFPGSKCSKSWRTNYQGLVSYLFVNSGQSGVLVEGAGVPLELEQLLVAKTGQRAMGNRSAGKRERDRRVSCPTSWQDYLWARLWPSGERKIMAKGGGRPTAFSCFRIHNEIKSIECPDYIQTVYIHAYLWALQKTHGGQCVNSLRTKHNNSAARNIKALKYMWRLNTLCFTKIS